jgi:hypothetical protein
VRGERDDVITAGLCQDLGIGRVVGVGDVLFAEPLIFRADFDLGVGANSSSEMASLAVRFLAAAFSLGVVLGVRPLLVVARFWYPGSLRRDSEAGDADFMSG